LDRILFGVNTYVPKPGADGVEGITEELGGLNPVKGAVGAADTAQNPGYAELLTELEKAQRANS
jgi:hypothetical protein